MRYVSLFSGIEAASVAWKTIGWEPMAFSEIEPFPCHVLAERFPSVPNLGNICDIDWEEFVEDYGRPDVIVGGSPCQSFSVAGGRESLSGESRLCFEYVRAVRETEPAWMVWENVPGVLNTRDNAFGQFICALWDCGYHDLSWRVLDAQFFGVAQRRRRVFVVGHLGDGMRSSAVLFERESVRGDHPSSREKRQELAAGAGRGAGEGDRGNCLTPWDAQSKRVFSPDGAATALQCGERAGGGVCPSVCFQQNQRDEVRLMGGDGQVAGSLSASSGMKNTNYVCMASTQANAEIDGDMCGTLTQRSCKDAPIVASPYVVRRLTPLECERLQGFPDGWTDVEIKGKPASDTARYRALGNSMAVPVMRWIGGRIEGAEAEGGGR